MVKKKSENKDIQVRSARRKSISGLITSLIVIVLLVYISSFKYFRLDLTSDNRYTLSNQTRKILKNLEDVAHVRVYLEGDLPYDLSRLQKSTREQLEEFRQIAGSNLQYEFINPSENPDPGTRKKIYTDLHERGLSPTNIEHKDEEGGTSEKIIFPGAIINYRGRELPVELLNHSNLPAEININNSIQMLEYTFIQAIQNLSDTVTRKIAFLHGNGELEEYHVHDASKALSKFYQIDRGAINGQLGILDQYEAVIIAQPTKPFNEKDKFVIDQYIMNGGKVAWFIDAVDVQMDSLKYGQTLAYNRSLNLEDQLFRYGARINYKLIKDVQCNVIPVNTGLAGEKPKWTPAPWLYYPLVSSNGNHTITNNLNMVKSEFVTPIDTVGGNPRVKKSILLNSSKYTRLVDVPAIIRLEEIKETPDKSAFNNSFQPVAVLLEGTFESIFRNRMYHDLFPGQKVDFIDSSVNTKMIVVSDGDIIKNDVRTTSNGPVIVPLGYDRFTKQTFGNKEFIVNAINYLTDETGLIQLRNREFKLRVLDKVKLKEEKVKWQVINTVIPILIVLVAGILFNYWRKRKYSA